MAVSKQPFSNSTIKSVVGDNFLDKAFKSYTSYLTLPNDGLFDRKRQRLLFTDLKSIESPDSGSLTSKASQQYMYPDVEVYVDPQRIRVNKNVIVNKTLTKGGWITQFWGLDLPVISVNALSGYFGLTKGRSPLVSAAIDVGNTVSNIRKSSSVGDFFKNQKPTTADPLKVFEKLKTYAFDNRFDGNLPFQGSPIIKMIYDNIVYKGYFSNFDYSLSADKPFVIDYNFQFVVITPPDKFSGLKNLSLAKITSSPMDTIGKGLSNGVVKTVAGDLRTVSDASLELAGGLANKATNKLFGKVGLKNTIDMTPSKIILA